jgi:hypothetical protein
MRSMLGLVTIPGLSLHLVATWIGCRIFKIPMAAPPSLLEGRVRHEPAPGLVRGLVVAVLPGAFLAVLGVGAMAATLLSLRLERSDPLAPLYLWVGASILIHAFPAEETARDLLRRSLRSFAGWLLFPATAVPLLIGAGRRYGVPYLLGCGAAAAVLFLGQA